MNRSDRIYIPPSRRPRLPALMADERYGNRGGVIILRLALIIVFLALLLRCLPRT